MLFDDYKSPWEDEELTMLRDASRKFFQNEFRPKLERWNAQEALPNG